MKLNNIPQGINQPNPEEERRFSFDKDEDGDIDAPLTQISAAYRMLSEQTIRCDDHSIEMVLGDGEYVCPHCEKRYPLGVNGTKIYCRRDDIKRNYMDIVQVPNMWLGIPSPVNWEYKPKKKNPPSITKPHGTTWTDGSGNSQLYGTTTTTPKQLERFKKIMGDLSEPWKDD